MERNDRLCIGLHRFFEDYAIQNFLRQLYALDLVGPHLVGSQITGRGAAAALSTRDGKAEIRFDAPVAVETGAEAHSPANYTTHERTAPLPVMAA